MSCYLDFTSQKSSSSVRPPMKDLSSSIGSIFNTEAEYVPLSFLNHRSLSNKTVAGLNNQFLSFCKETHNLSRIVKDRSIDVGKMNNDDASMFLTVMKNGIKDYVNNNRFNCEIEYGSSYASKEYYHLLNGVSNNHDWSMSVFKNKRYMSTFGLISEVNYSYGWNNLHSFNPLVCFAVKREHMAYVRLCYLLNKEIDKRAIKVFVKEGFDTKLSNDKNLRMRYRKYILPEIKEKGYEIVNVENLKDKFMLSVSIPKEVKTIRARKEWAKESVAEFMEVEKINNKAGAFELCL